MFDLLSQWELPLLHSIQDAGTELGSKIWTGITMLGESGIFWIVLSLVLMIFKKTRRAGFTMGLALLIGVILGNGVMKNLFARTRPYDLDPNLIHRLAWGEMSTDYSFPSGHTLASFEAAVGLMIYHRKWGIAALCAAFCVMLSRLFLLVHFPSDLLAGALFGTAFAFLAAKIVDLLWKAYDRRQLGKN